MKNNRAFSLVELLVVISVIAVLSAVLMPNFVGSRERARDAKKIQELDSLKSALRSYYNDYQAYPTPNNQMLGAGFSGYAPGIVGVGHTYYRINNGDGFQLCVALESGAGDGDVDSQRACGIGTTAVCGLGTTTDRLYSVCSY